MQKDVYKRQIYIRGRRSLSGDNAPLYIVDGVPMQSIDEINSSDIASLEVLKDASSVSYTHLDVYKRQH